MADKMCRRQNYFSDPECVVPDSIDWGLLWHCPVCGSEWIAGEPDEPTWEGDVDWICTVISENVRTEDKSLGKG